MRYWLMKSEPDDVSIDDLARQPEQRVGWYGVRNYQARNFMRDQMQVGDMAFFYHSGCAEPGIAGVVQICCPAYADPTQFDPKHRYFDAKSTQAAPRWWQVDVCLIRKTRFMPLTEMRTYSELASMRVLQKGNRLSLTPVDENEWIFLLNRL